MDQKIIAVIIIAILIISGVGVAALLGAGEDTDKDNPLAGETRIDAKGREVAIPDNLDNGIVTVGSSGPLRFLSIFDMYDKVVQVDKGDVTDMKNGRAYSYAYPYDEFTTDMYHPDNALEAATMERIGQKSPSLIIVQESVYDSYKDNCDDLAQSFTLVVIHAQSMVDLWKDNFTLADWYVDNVELIGDMVGKPQRAAEHIADVNEIIADIRGLVGSPSGISTYVAGLTIQGSNELTTTFPSYLPLMLVDGINAHGGNQPGRVEMEAEAVALLDVDMVVIDPSSSDKLGTVNSQLIMKWIHGLNNDGDPNNDVRLYITLPIIWDSNNYDCVLAGSYYMAHLLYGTISMEEVEGKVVEVFQAYYGDSGANVYGDMKEFFVGKSSSNGQVMPLLRPVDVELNGDVYRMVAA